jgi:hypothetical protein
MRAAAALAVLLVTATLAAQNFPERPASALAFFQNNESVAALGSDGKDFLVIGFRDPAGMIANRVTANGTVLDGAGIPIAPLAGFIQLLGVFWGGEAYTVVWQNGGGLYVARIDRDGHLIDGPRFIMSNANYWGGVSNGNRIVLAGGRAIALDPRGNVVNDFGMLPGEAGDHYSVAWNGSGFMMSWASGSNERSVNIAPLDADGRPLGTFKKIAAPNTFETHIASDGSDYVVVYGGSTIVAHHVSAAGEFLESHTAPGSFQSQQSIAWTGATYVVAASATQRFPSVVRLDRSGTPIDSAPLSIASLDLTEYPSTMLATTSGQQVLLSWVQQSDSRTRSFAAFLGSDGQKSNSVIALGITPTVQMTPQIANSGRNFIVVWEEQNAVYASRLSYTGEPLDGRGIRLSTKAGQAPRVAWDGQSYVVAWLAPEIGAITTAHVSADGTVLEASEKPALASCRSEFDLAIAGDTAFVVGTECVTWRVAGARVHRDGIAEPPIVISEPQVLAEAPHVAWNGGRYLVVWRDLLCAGLYVCTRTRVRGARVSSGMTLLDPEPLNISSDTADHADALVASNGSQFLTAFSAPQGGGVWVREVSGDGALAEVMLRIADDGIGTSLIWDGARYTAAFVAHDDVFLARIGHLSRVLLAASRDAEGGAALAAAGKDGRLLVAYRRMASEAPYGSVWRVFVQGIGPRERAVR